MGLIFEVRGASANFKLEADEIRSYDFAYKASESKYAKGSNNSRELIVKGCIRRTLATSKEAMEEIRGWAKEKYKDPSYYSYVKITAMYRDEVVRAITFPNAFIKNYKEEINPHSGDGTYTITLLQKIDKRIGIVVDPFNVVHPTLSQLTAKYRKNAAAATAPSPSKDEVPINSLLPAEYERPRNSPYWVERSCLAHSRIIVNRPMGFFVRPSTAEAINESFTFNVGTRLEVIRSRLVGSVRWYYVEHEGRYGWIPRSNGGNTIVSHVPEESGIAGEKMIVTVRNPDNVNSIDSIARVWGRGTPVESGNLLSSDADFQRITVQDSGFNGMRGTRSVDSIRGLEDGTVVTINQPDNPIISPLNAPVEWIRVDSWSAGILNNNATGRRIETLDDRGINLLANMERGLNDIVFDSTTGAILSIPTTLEDVGYGRDRIQRPMNPEPSEVSAMEALRLLREDASGSELAIATQILIYDQDQFNALVSLRFNIGFLGNIEGLLEYLEGGVFVRDELGNLINTHYRNIIARNPQRFERYRQGWYNRTERFLNVFFDGNYGHMPIDAVNEIVIR